MTDAQLRAAVIETARRMNAAGINQGTSGNVSARTKDGFLITPSGARYETLAPADIVAMDGEGGHPAGQRPSSEWRFHKDIYRARPEAGAVVHAHAPYATTLACLGRDIPAFHYMIAVAGGETIRCAPYATFGSQALSDHALVALEGRRACLLANHGMIAFGADLDAAFDLAVEVEALAGQYWRALQIGEPHLLSPDEMAEVLKKFRSYGPRAGDGNDA